QLSIVVFGPLSTFGFVIMVNQRLNSENTEARERLEFVFNISPGAVAITRMDDGRVVDMNEAFSVLTGYAREEILGRSVLDLRIWAKDEDRERFLQELRAKGSCLNREFVFGKKDGSSLIGIISARLFTLDGQPHILSVTTDISERKRSEGEISRLALQLELERNYAQTSAMTDGLTGLANRRRFDEVLRSDFFRLKRTKAQLSMIMLDVDYFKKYNDSYGHIAGDDCLKHIAAILRKAVGRAHDTVARYGGEEFAVIMPETDIFGALALAERIRKAVESHAIPHSASKVSPFVTVSIGVATVDTAEIVSQDEIIQRADAALYEAKKAGRNRIEQSRSPVAKDGNGAEHHPRENLVKLVWSSYDESGNATIDREHRQLFETSNMLVDAIVRGGASEFYLPLLESLLEDIVSHFEDEEGILREIKFPYAEEHAALHTALVNKALDLAAKCRRGEANVGELFSFVVYEIIARHLLMDDKKFFPYVASR
ncbi:MAG TPA: diguanylate cyclase, partial [Rectinemataceae bacterium]|nr:diguanylate cyclase [Rectinemataceae bacterium]